MKKLFLLAGLPLVVLASCNGGVTSSTLSTGDSEEEVSSSETEGTSSVEVVEKDVKFMSPSGAPALAFYDQGNNENWINGTAAEIRPNFLTDTYDALVLDSVTGLNTIANNENSHFKLASFLTGGNFYIVSTTKGVDDVPDANSRFLSFNENSLPDTVFKKLAKDHWNWDLEFTSGGNINYLASTAEVSAQLAADPDAYDYYFIAEPSLTSARGNLGTSATITEIFNLRAEWKEFSNQDAIPQAALFVNEQSYNSDKAAFDLWLDHVAINQEKASSGDPSVTETLNAYGSLTEQAARFGFNANLYNALQVNGDNRFGLLDGSEIDNHAFINEFYNHLDGSENRFAEDLFLDR